MTLAPFLWSLPWVVPPIVALLRARHSFSLDDVPAAPPPNAPLVSVIVPARNEARNIERCLRSILSSRYPALEVITVNDHSSDDTGTIAQFIARDDPRLRVIDAPDLPAGWLGKQWACSAGAREAHGELLLFTDADTRHGEDLLPRAVNALVARNADMLTVGGRQEMHSFWERVIQPQMFALLSIRYGGTEAVSNARRPEDAIANGQFILVRRPAYDSVGGHATVKDCAAEDLALAQEFVRTGKRLVLVLAVRQFSTHMYASLRELVAGWKKNVYAGGRAAALGGAAGRALYPLFLLAVPVMGLLPPIALLLALTGALSTAWLMWASLAIATALVFWAAIYWFMEQPLFYAFLYPLGLALLLYISTASVARGARVEWKGREYTVR